MRRVKLVKGEYYHVFNRGFDKMDIFLEKRDIERFYLSMQEFNTVDTIGSIYENYFIKKKLGTPSSKQKLVEFICYCLNPNHFHFLLRQSTDCGIEKLMQKLGGGYAKYFNQKYKRSGYLFQGSYRIVHVNSNEYLLHLSVYINLNFKVHKLGTPSSKSSWEEYLTGKAGGLCDKSIILDQFPNPKEYKEFAEYSLESIIARKDMDKLRVE
jgi:putative transposase